MDRTKLSEKNAVFALTSQFIILAGQFVLQTIFVRFLSTRYLGANGLFTNLVSFLSFSELGIGSAITYSLYKPLSENNVGQINAIMHLFKKVYEIIGIAILIVGIGLSFFIDSFIKSGQSIPNIQFLFILYLISTVVSYFFTYTRSLLIANQIGYISSINQLIFKMMQIALQIPILIFTRSYTLYLVVLIFANLASNIRISRVALKEFNYLDLSSKEKVNDNTLKRMRQNVVGTISSKIGEIIVFGTDNVLISKFIGLTAVGLYSNYVLIINGISSVISQGFNALIASFGNLAVSENKTKQVEVFYKYLYIVSIITFVVSSTFLTVVQPFIFIWFGKNLKLSNIIVLLITINFILTEMRQATLGFISAMGLFWQMRYKSLIEAILNLVISLVLIGKYGMGIEGVLLGTLGSTILVNLWWEPYVLFRFGLKTPMLEFWKKYIIYLTVIIGIQLLIYRFSGLVVINKFYQIVLVAVCALFFYTCLFSIIFFKSEEAKYFNRFVLRKIVGRR